MESNKYYIPTIEEFYVGFEYEIKNAFWDKIISTKNIFYESLEYHLNNGNIRVKYLDQEDIESLGFIKHKTIDNYWKLNNIVLRIKNFKISIYVYDDYTVDKLIFEGIIKNKSELIKLLKQLNINEIK